MVSFNSDWNHTPLRSMTNSCLRFTCGAYSIQQTKGNVNAVSDIVLLLKEMRPVLADGEFVYATVPDLTDFALTDALCVFREARESPSSAFGNAQTGSVSGTRGVFARLRCRCTRPFKLSDSSLLFPALSRKRAFHATPYPHTITITSSFRGTWQKKRSMCFQLWPRPALRRHPVRPCNRGDSSSQSRRSLSPKFRTTNC
jgi:hypothetical protein